MESFEEPLTKHQREELEGIVAFSTRLLRVVLFIIFALLTGSLFRWLQHHTSVSIPLWLIPTAVVLAWLYVRSSRWTGGSNLRQQVRADLETGNAVVTVIEPKLIEEVEELEDEGPSYIIETKDNEHFILTGQEMERYKHKKFPWTKFGVIEAPQSKLFFGLKQMGEPIPVTSKRPPFSYQEAKQLGCFNADFIILKESLIKSGRNS